jgi:hypothetical protein
VNKFWSGECIHLGECTFEPIEEVLKSWLDRVHQGHNLYYQMLVWEPNLIVFISTPLNSALLLYILKPQGS